MQQQSNKKKLVIVGFLVAVALYLSFDTYFGGTSHKSTTKKTSSDTVPENSVITQKIVKETTIVKEPEIANRDPIPMMTKDDIQFIRDMRQEETLEHNLKVQQLNSDIAKAALEQATANSKVDPEGKLVNEITGGGVPYAAKSSTSNLNIGVSETTVSDENDQNQAPDLDFLVQQAFEGLTVASLSTNNEGTDVWLKYQGDLFHVFKGFKFNGFEVLTVTPNTIEIEQVISGFKKTFQMTSISYPKNGSDPSVEYQRDSDTTDELPQRG
ncbi:hypothetical protein HUO09_17030 [Vibrio sp. Y2-5]|uniref:hypothetical protein n=1 Tax=Vibrio sp. Y2-5 TaxID=2743977 RepID=UPI0016613880|nr:hypothetical protein [Vibrio sp. Y2-5]MBD0788060.1 hypothetical protein [Vibrio sp. Y2-5]